MTLAESVISIAAVITAMGVIGGAVVAIIKFIERQKEQDKEIRESKDERALLCFGISACLDGLIQLGANHTVPVAKDRLDKFLNKQAHK